MSKGYSYDFDKMTLSEAKVNVKRLTRQLSRYTSMDFDYEKENKNLKSEILPLKAENKDLKIQNSSLLTQINVLKENSKDSKKDFICSVCIIDSKINFAGIIESKEKEILNLQAKLKKSESLNLSSSWSKKESMQRELDELRRRANIARETSEGLRKTNSQVFAERDKLKDKVFSLEVEIDMQKEKATQDKDNTKPLKRIKSLELKCVKLSQQVSDFEKVIILEREKVEKEKKISEQNKVNIDFSEEKKVFETEIAKLTRELSELSTIILKEKKTNFELQKKFDQIEKERNSLSSKIKELEESVFKVKLTDHKTPESIAQSPRDDQTDSDCSLKKTSSSHFSNVFYNPFCDLDDGLTSKSTDQIHSSNLFFDKNVDGSGNLKKTKSRKKSFWRRDDEKDRGNWIWKVKGSSEEKNTDKSFLHTSNAKWNYVSKGKTFGKPDLVYTINQLIRSGLLPHCQQDDF
ncbi:hypothetical protein L6452_43647 [Arctium lappa]|uniref:Uncharacterized protein n=1 Tax=Arctium lappa TaxID=4217 RepID=A0ACB8XDQ3_ARCLA|nr:hypothetical protein L6452_43647 [Arctium lappa]